MKKTILLFSAILICSISLSGQIKGGVTWFDAGLKIQFGGAGLSNKALVNSTEYNYDLGLASGLGLGGRLGFNYDDHGIILEFLLNKGSQPLEKQSDNSTLDVDWGTYDLTLLYRNSKNKGYFELGPKYSLINKVERTGSDGVTVDMKDQFQNYASGVIGFGAYLLGNDGAFQGLLGLRAEYGFTDAVTADGRAMGSPVGDASVYADEPNAATNIVFAGIVFELNWGIGYYAKAGCGSRSKFIRF